MYTDASAAPPPHNTIQYVPLRVSRQEDKMLSRGKGGGSAHYGAKPDERLDDGRRDGSDIGAPFGSFVASCRRREGEAVRHFSTQG